MCKNGPISTPARDARICVLCRPGTRPRPIRQLIVGRSAARDRRQQVDFAVGSERLVARVMEDLAVDGDRGLLELRRERREPIDERSQEIVHPRRVDYDPLSTGCVGCPSAWKVDCRHSVIPCSTRGGDSGSSVKRTPVAARIALAIVASGGTIGTSPTPRTPYGCSGFATSTSTASIIGRSEATGIR